MAKATINVKKTKNLFKGIVGTRASTYIGKIVHVCEMDISLSLQAECGAYGFKDMVHSPKCGL